MVAEHAHEDHCGDGSAAASSCDFPPSMLCWEELYQAAQWTVTKWAEISTEHSWRPLQLEKLHGSTWALFYLLQGSCSRRLIRPCYYTGFKASGALLFSTASWITLLGLATYHGFVSVTDTTVPALWRSRCCWVPAPNTHTQHTLCTAPVPARHLSEIRQAFVRNTPGACYITSVLYMCSVFCFLLINTLVSATIEHVNTD